MTILETERLILRELRTEDKYSLSKVLSDYDSMQYYDHTFNEHEVEEWIKWNIENYATYNCVLWAVILKEDGTFLGDCGIPMQNIDGEVHPRLDFILSKNTVIKVMHQKRQMHVWNMLLMFWGLKRYIHIQL